MSDPDTTSSPGETALEVSLERLSERLPCEVFVYELGVQQIVVRDKPDGPGVAVYKRAGTTADVDDMVAHDGPVILDGAFRRVREDEFGTPRAYHPWGGDMGAIGDESPGETRVEAVLLTEVERLV